jgi:dsDNA-specific endonuclease/ATPase MutS2
MIKLDDIFIKNLPTIDLHGTTRDIARVILIDFINDNAYLDNKKLVVIHGIGLGIIKHEVHDELKDNKMVLSYNIDPYNSGVTIVNLK